MAVVLKDQIPRVRNIIIATTCIIGLVAYFGGSITMMQAYSRWLWLCPPWQAFVFSIFPQVLYAILGATYFIVVNRLLSPKRSILWGGVFVYAVSFPIAIMLLWTIRHIGGANIINAIKSGYVLPIVVFSLGLPLIKEDGKPDVYAAG
jgi:hypothetical protein